MVFNLIVDIKDGGTWGIEASEQLVYHNEKFHLGRTLDEEALCPLLIVISIIDTITSILERLLCPIILEFGFGFLAGVS